MDSLRCRWVVACGLVVLCFTARAATWTSNVQDGWSWADGKSLDDAEILAFIQSDDDDAITQEACCADKGDSISDEKYFSVYFNNDFPSDATITVTSVKVYVDHQGKSDKSGTLVVHVSDDKGASSWYNGGTGSSDGNSGNVSWNENEQRYEFDVTSILDTHAKINNCEVLILNKDSSDDKVYFDYACIEVEYEVGLVAWYKLDEATGTTAPDASSSGNNGTLAGGPAWQPAGGRIDGALEFDGSDDYVSGPTGIADFSGAFTVSMWAKLDSISMWDPLIGVTQDDGNYAFVLCLENGLKLYTKLDWGLDWTTTHSMPIETGVWYHFAVVLDAGSNSTVYVNGVGYPSGWVTQRNNLGTLHIGRIANAPVWTEAIDGLIDEVRIYERALAPAEVDALYVGGYQAEPPAITTPAADPAESPVSPAWVEGTVVPGATSLTVSVDSGASFDATLMDRTHWFADNASVGGAPLGIVLSETVATAVEVTAGFVGGVEMTASRTITWVETIIDTDSAQSITIRKGDSLRLVTAETSGTLEIDLDYDGATFTADLTGPAGTPIRADFNSAGEFTVRAHVNGVFAGEMTVVVIEVGPIGPIACQIGYQREKDIAITPPAYASQVSFAAAEPHLLEASVKESTAEGVTLYLKAHHRGTPVLVARLGGATGPILTMKEIDEFTLDIPARVGFLVVNDGPSGSVITIRPFVPDLDMEFDMFASTSTFMGGATFFTINTSDAESSLGEPGFQQVFDAETGETVGKFAYALEVPPEENMICFNLTGYQSGSYARIFLETGINGEKCYAKVEKVIVCANTTGNIQQVLVEYGPECDVSVVSVTRQEGVGTGGKPNYTTLSFYCTGEEHTDELVFDAGPQAGTYDVEFQCSGSVYPSKAEGVIKVISGTTALYLRSIGEISPDPQEFSADGGGKGANWIVDNITATRRQLGVAPIGTGNSMWPTAPNLAEIVGSTCDHQQGDTYSWKRGYALRQWLIKRTGVGNEMVVEHAMVDWTTIEIPTADAGDVTPSGTVPPNTNGTRKVYDFDNPRITPFVYGLADQVGEAIVKKSNFIQALYRTRGGATDRIALLEWFTVNIMVRKNMTGSFEEKWKRFEREEAVREGSISLALDQATAQQIVSSVQGYQGVVGPVDPNLNLPLDAPTPPP